MRRFSIVAAVFFSLAVGLAAGHLRPEITAVTPQSPAPSKTSQNIVVNGKEFAAGLSLSITSPNGSVADYRGNSITDLRETSFRANVMLAEIGSYRLVVVNPDSQTSLPFALTVKGPVDAPSISAVKPPGLRVSTSPQTLTIEGARFDAGLHVSLTDPAGNVQNLGGDAIRNVLPNTFQLTVTLETAGRYEIVVTNPNGRASNGAGFDVGRQN